MTIATTFSRMVITLRGSTHKVRWFLSHVVLCGHVTNMCSISTFTRQMNTKHGKVGTDCKEHSP